MNKIKHESVSNNKKIKTNTSAKSMRAYTNTAIKKCLSMELLFFWLKCSLD